MSLNLTPSSERIQIMFTGKTNTGKSSLINAVTNQPLSIVSDIKGTTTDPVYKNMELLPLGPVTLIDTAGYDDSGELGELRKKKTKEILYKTDIAVLTADAKTGLTNEDKEFIEFFEKNGIIYIIVYNKSDLTEIPETHSENEIYVSAKNKTGIEELKELIIKLYKEPENKRTLCADLIEKNDNVILVVPIDSSAPKGRLILPQQQVLRELLEKGAITTVVQPSELKAALNSMKNKPKLVITDSQAFKEVNEILPEDINLTSFSILFARYKGVLTLALKGIEAVKTLNDGDKILIAEGCTHHRQCEDIGSVKIPNMLKKSTGKELIFEFASGSGFPENLYDYKMIIHCGSCMLREREVLRRYKTAEINNIPVTNYGIFFAYLNGITERCKNFI